MRRPLSCAALLAILLLAACSSPPPKERTIYSDPYPPDSKTHTVTPYP